VTKQNVAPRGVEKRSEAWRSEVGPIFAQLSARSNAQ